MKLVCLPPPTSPQYAVQNNTTDGAGKVLAWIQRVSGTPVKAGFENYKLQTDRIKKKIIIFKQRA
jgi:hypothetical protein